MEVGTNLNVGGVNEPVQPRRAASKAAKAEESVSLTSSAAVERALKNVLDTRAESVDRARGLIADVSYPPLETIRKISRLLAIKISSDEP